MCPLGALTSIIQNTSPSMLCQFIPTSQYRHCCEPNDQLFGYIKLCLTANTRHRSAACIPTLAMTRLYSLLRGGPDREVRSQSDVLTRITSSAWPRQKVSRHGLQCLSNAVAYLYCIGTISVLNIHYVYAAWRRMYLCVHALSVYTHYPLMLE